MADRYGIIYAAASKAVRRIVLSDDPNYNYAGHVGTGEEYLVADKKNGTDIFAARAAVEAATGEKSSVPLVAVVDKSGIVVGMTLADPLLDTIEDHDIVLAYAGVFEGCAYDKQSDSFITPKIIIPAGVDMKGNSVPQKTIDPASIAKPQAVTADASDEATAEPGVKASP